MTFPAVCGTITRQGPNRPPGGRPKGCPRSAQPAPLQSWAGFFLRPERSRNHPSDRPAVNSFSGPRQGHSRRVDNPQKVNSIQCSGPGPYPANATKPMSFCCVRWDGAFQGENTPAPLPFGCGTVLAYAFLCYKALPSGFLYSAKKNSGKSRFFVSPS